MTKYYQKQKGIFHNNKRVIHGCVPNNRASKTMRQKWTALKREIDNSAITVGDVNILSLRLLE